MFNRYNSNLLFIIVLAIFALTDPKFNLMSTLLTLPGIILAITFHEYAHARVSDRLGDPTPDRQGRLTLNPIAHLDPVGTIFLIFAGFGWGKPVEINPNYYRNPLRDNMLVAIAGPLTNIVLGFILFIFTALIAIFLPASKEIDILYSMVQNAALINIALAVFNFLPLPPLDGSKILRYFLRGKASEFLFMLEKYSTLILLILFITNIPEKIITPVVYGISSFMVWIIGLVIGLFI